MTGIEWSREAIQAAWKAFNVASENPMKNALNAACEIQGIERLRAENEKLRAERDLWISRFEDFRKNAARLEEARSRPMRLVGSAAAAALKETENK